MNTPAKAWVANHKPQFPGDLKELLLKEYDHLSASMAANEELGDKRVGLFVTLTTALGGVMVFAADKIAYFGVAPLHLVAVLLAFWFLIGLTTLSRIVHRNLSTHECMRQLRRIRQCFVAADDLRAQRILAFDAFGDVPIKQRKGLFGNGGYLEVTVLLNAMILGTGAAVTALLFGVPGDSPWLLVLALGIAGGAWLLQLGYIEGRYDSVAAKVKADEDSFNALP